MKHPLLRAFALAVAFGFACAAAAQAASQVYPSRFAAKIKSEMVEWGKVFKDAGIRAD